MDFETFRQQAASAIRDDKTHGASELARAAVRALGEWARTSPAEDEEQLRAELLELSETLASTRPSMGAIGLMVTRWADALPRYGGSLSRSAAEGAVELEQISLEAVEQAAARAASHVPSRATILTHSSSSTVRSLLEQVADRRVRAIVTESRPLCEGRETARFLSRLGLRTELITDAQAGVFMREADLVVVGADAVLANGTIINKAGTYLLALAAHEHQVPFIACFESFKWSKAELVDFDLEEGSPDELGGAPIDNVRRRNVVFDATPPELVSLWIDENGEGEPSGG